MQLNAVLPGILISSREPGSGDERYGKLHMGLPQPWVRKQDGPGRPPAAQGIIDC